MNYEDMWNKLRSTLVLTHHGFTSKGLQGEAGIIEFVLDEIKNQEIIEEARYKLNRQAKAGDRIRITDNVNDHPFKLGQEVTVTEWNDFGDEDADVGVEAVADGINEHWFVRHTDYVVVR